MFRRYNRWQSRFDQPDPSDGSYDTTDPQSFNRYAYVQGDPVNFVDPTGLDGEFTCVPGDNKCNLGEVTVSPDRLSGASGGGHGVHPPLLESPNEFVGGPQIPAPHQTDCHVMADVAQNEANDAMMQNPHDLQSALRTFDAAFNTLYSGGPLVSKAAAIKRWAAGSQPAISYAFRDSGDGFNPEFRDSDRWADDQTHHFSAHFSLGINGQRYASEYHRKGDNAGDVRLSETAYEMGRNLRLNPAAGLPNIGRTIRSILCDSYNYGLIKP
jgi:hypothetical protein